MRAAQGVRTGNWCGPPAFAPVSSLGSFVSVKCELICARGPRLLVSVTLQHADHSAANEQQETSAVLQAGKLCADISNRCVGQIAPDRCVSRNDEIGKKASAGEP